MKIIHSSELMKNQKQAEVMAPDSKFLALQTNEGHSLFFSIGSDQIFYLIKEVSTAVTGWDKADLSSGLTQFHAGKKITAKTFDVSQNPFTGTIDIALVITVDGADFLYLSQNNSNTDTLWSNNISWLIMPFDDRDHAVPLLVITDVYITQSSGSEYILADILKNPESGLDFIFRYTIDPSKRVAGQLWIPNDLAANLNANSIQSCLGRKKGQTVDGIYTYGKIQEIDELIYTPLYNAFDVTIAPSPTRLKLPPKTTAIASAIAGNSASTPGGKPIYTNLFVAAEQSLYFFSYDQQTDGHEGLQIVRNDIIQDVRTLYANSTATHVVIWGLNQQGVIFYLACATGQENDPSAWSYPIPILTGVEQLSFFLNNQRDNNILFAHTQGQELLQLTQDPVTTIWQQRNIMLPATDTDDIVESDTFTTHIQISREDNLFAAGIPVAITATSPVSVYINNRYYQLHQTSALRVAADETGVITIVQETQNLGAVCYHLEIEEGNAVDINPMNQMIDTMSTVQSGADLAAVEVTNEDGSKQPLVPKDTPKDQLDVTADALQQLVTVSAALPADGSNQPDTGQVIGKTAFVATAGSIWGVSYKQGDWQYYQGEAALDFFSPIMTAESIGQTIKCFAGDVFNWMKHAYDDVTSFVVKLVDNVYNFFLEIGGQIFQFVLNSIATVIRCIEFVFDKIKVFIEDLIKWIGFLFQWGDILRTHDAIKNIFQQYTNYSIDNLTTYKEQLQILFESLEGKINGWAGLPNVPNTISGYSSAAEPQPGQDSPQANWGVYQFKSNIETADTNFNPTVPGGSTIEELLLELVSIIEAEGETMLNAVKTLKTQVIDQLSSLSATTIAKRIIAIIIDVFLETAENVTLKTIDIIQTLVQGAFKVLDAPIRIPVLSKLYKLITKGNDLSMLDLACLIAAIPVTITYKLCYGKAPFPNDDFTKAVIGASSFQAIQQLYRVPKNLPGEAITNDGNNATTLQRIFNYCGGAGSLLVAATNVLKLGYPNSGVLACVSTVCYLPYLAPSIYPSVVEEQAWYMIMNETICGVSIVKAVADTFQYKLDVKNPQNNLPILKLWSKASPWVEMLLNTLWEVPVMFILINSEESANAVVSYLGGTSFNLGGMLTPLLASEDPLISVVGLAGVDGCVLLSGTMDLALAIVP